MCGTTVSVTRVPIRYWLTPELVVTCSRVDCHEASDPGPDTASPAALLRSATIIHLTSQLLKYYNICCIWSLRPRPVTFCDLCWIETRRARRVACIYSLAYSIFWYVLHFFKSKQIKNIFISQRPRNGFLNTALLYLNLIWDESLC